MTIFQQIKQHIKYHPYSLAILFPNSKQKGAEVYFDSPSYNSWSYNVNKGICKDFRTNESMDIIETYRRIKGIANIKEAACNMAASLGINVTDITNKQTQNLVYEESEGYDDQILQDNNNMKNTKYIDNKYIDNIWNESGPIGGTIVEQYLRNRGITLPFSSTQKGEALRYHSRLYHSYTKQCHPAMVGAMYNASGELKALHRTYLHSDGRKLFTEPELVKENKKLLGNAKGLALIIRQPKSQEIAICEGIESGLSLRQRFNCEVWCSYSANNMPNLELPIDRDITIYPDWDNVGMHNAWLLKEKMYQKHGKLIQIYVGDKTKQKLAPGNNSTPLATLAAESTCKQTLSKITKIKQDPLILAALNAFPTIEIESVQLVSEY